jgi:hypothetical protein
VKPNSYTSTSLFKLLQALLFEAWKQQTCR